MMASSHPPGRQALMDQIRGEILNMNDFKINPLLIKDTRIIHKHHRSDSTSGTGSRERPTASTVGSSTITRTMKYSTVMERKSRVLMTLSKKSKERMMSVKSHSNSHSSLKGQQGVESTMGREKSISLVTILMMRTSISKAKGKERREMLKELLKERRRDVSLLLMGKGLIERQKEQGADLF